MVRKGTSRNRGLRPDEPPCTSHRQAEQNLQIEELERHERTGRPLGDDRFIELVEKLLSRDLKKKKPGPKGADK